MLQGRGYEPRDAGGQPRDHQQLEERCGVTSSPEPWWEPALPTVTSTKVTVNFRGFKPQEMDRGVRAQRSTGPSPHLLAEPGPRQLKWTGSGMRRFCYDAENGFIPTPSGSMCKGRKEESTPLTNSDCILNAGSVTCPGGPWEPRTQLTTDFHPKLGLEGLRVNMCDLLKTIITRN